MNLKSCFSIISLITLIHSTTMAQEPSRILDLRYNGGEAGFLRFLQGNLMYPAISLQNNTVGLSVSAVTLTPEGKIDTVVIINPVDQYIDQEVIRVVNASKRNFLKSDTISENQVFYVQVYYEKCYSCDKPRDIKLPKSRDFVEPVIMTAMTRTDENLPMSNPMLAGHIVYLMERNEFEEALFHLFEMIRRDPYNVEWYNLRMFVYKKLLTRDAQRIQNFIPGIPLEKLVTQE